MITKSKSRIAFTVCNFVFFAFLILLCFYPFWYVLIQSLSGRVIAGKALLVPYQFTLYNYGEVFRLPGVFHALGVSIARTVIGTGLTVLCCMLLGYLFSKQEMPCRRLLYRMLTITMYVSGGLIPIYLTYKAYGLVGSFWVYIFPSLISPYYVILIKTFVEQLPESIEESAKLDGAGTIVLFFRIILPMSLPILATIAIYASVGQWNAWFDNHIYNFQTDSLTTMQYLLYTYLNEARRLAEMLQEGNMEHLAAYQLTPQGVRMTVTMLTILPVLMVYPFLQRFFIKGIMIGAVKG